jgi:phenylalanyl-tRNA synthetase alpha chain
LKAYLDLIQLKGRMDLLTTNLDELANTLGLVLKNVQNASDLEMVKRDWIGREGTIKLLFKQLKALPDDRRPAIAAKLNEIKSSVEQFIQSKESEFSTASQVQALNLEYIDLSLPGSSPGLGSIHPVTRIERRFAELLKPFGFRAVPGPEIETEYFCFDALNIPKHHPARDMQDTFFTDTGHVLRTHTTAVQARELRSGALPLKVASFGRVYRNETEDASHQAMFHQFELVWVEEGLTLANLMALIQHILKGLYGKRTKIRFVSKYYPYTEPSIGPQIDCAVCHGNGCGLCGGSGWLTVGGAGMIHRNVFTEFKYDPDKVAGLAFGMGSSRLAAQFCNFPHLRAVYDNDLRVLKHSGR